MTCCNYAVSIKFLDRERDSGANALWHIAKHARGHLECRNLGCRWENSGDARRLCPPPFSRPPPALGPAKQRARPRGQRLPRSRKAATKKRLSARRAAAKNASHASS